GRRPPAPTRWTASDRTASHVLQGGGNCADWSTAQRWLPSRRLSRATTKPASTITLLAVTRPLQVRLLARGEVWRQPFNRPNEIGNGVDDRGAPTSLAGGAPQALTNDVGFRQLPPAGLGLDLGDECLGQSHRQRLHGEPDRIT